MQEHGWVKKQGHKIISTVRFYFYEVQEQARLICGDRNQIWGWLWMESGTD